MNERYTIPNANNFSNLQGGAVALYFGFVCLTILFILFMYYRVGRKAGYSKSSVIIALILSIIPPISLIYSLYFVFAKWPIEKEVEYYRSLTRKNN